MTRLRRQVLSAALLLGGCTGHAATMVTGGDAERGRAAIARYSCGACHQIAGVSGASGRVGPRLDHIGEQTIIAGRLPNIPDSLVHWIRDPQAIAPGNAMPTLGISDATARDIAAYLYTLR
jgi:cytochrome c